MKPYIQSGEQSTLNMNDAMRGPGEHRLGVMILWGSFVPDWIANEHLQNNCLWQSHFKLLHLLKKKLCFHDFCGERPQVFSKHFPTSRETEHSQRLPSWAAFSKGCVFGVSEHGCRVNGALEPWHCPHRTEGVASVHIEKPAESNCVLWLWAIEIKSELNLIFYWQRVWCCWNQTFTKCIYFFVT